MDFGIEKFFNFQVNNLSMKLHLVVKFFFSLNVEDNATNKVNRIKLAHPTSLYLQIENTNGWNKVIPRPGNFVPCFHAVVDSKKWECSLISPLPYDNFSERDNHNLSRYCN